MCKPGNAVATGERNRARALKLRRIYHAPCCRLTHLGLKVRRSCLLALDDPNQRALDELRARGLHGEEAARNLSSDERFQPPPEEEVPALRILAFERDGFPHFQGLVAGLYVDVLLGRRGIHAALDEATTAATSDGLSPAYCSELEVVAASLVRDGRAGDGLLLAALLLTATESAFGAGSRLWICGASPFIQAVTQLRDTVDINLRPLLERAPSIVDLLVTAARDEHDAVRLSSCLSVAGQFWWTTASGAEGSQEQEMLRKAEEALSGAAALRDGAERGRTLATLAQVQARLHERGLVAAPVVAATAAGALRLVDRDKRPLQWLAARRVLGAVDPTHELPPGFSVEELRLVRSELGDQIAAECLVAELDALQSADDPRAAKSLLMEILPTLRLGSHVSQAGRRALFSSAIHLLDEGAVPCRAVAAAEAELLFGETARLASEPQLLARLHLALHAAPTTKTTTDWAVHTAGGLLDSVPEGFARDAAVFAVAEIHAGQASLEGADVMFRFRCALLAASIAAQLDLTEAAIPALGLALSLAREWAPTALAAAGEAALADARVQLEGILDACLRETAMLDVLLGDASREWVSEVGRATSAPARLSRVSAPWAAVAHSAAFKAAVTSRMLADPTPAPVLPQATDLLHNISALRRREDEDPPDQVALPGADEVRLCAWLHGNEQLSGSTTSHQRANLEARFDDLRTRTVVASRSPWNLGLHDFPFAALERCFDDRTSLVDMFLGRDESSAYCTYVNVYFRGAWRQYGARMPDQELIELPNPVDPLTRVLIDGLGLLTAQLRDHVQEPSGYRPVSRLGEESLRAVSERVLGALAGDLPALRAAGCSQLVVCPHGPLFFLPFHLLPVDEGILADHFTVTVVPALGAIVAPPSHSRAERDFDLGIIASPNGGVPFGLPAEPRLHDQAVALSQRLPRSIMAPIGRATPQAALELLSKSRFAHIASHGSALGSSPAFHRLFLDADEPASGELFAHQILSTDLRGLELVSLCACETALGRADPAGNIRGLPTALLGAGAEAVVATLWPVSADAALFFFAELYSHLSTGTRRVNAYHSAQQATRGQFPRFVDWGAFTYIGAWEEQ